jgi:hypothetical protein
VHQTHTLPAPTRARVHWLAPLVIVIVAAMLLGLALIGTGNDQSASRAVASDRYVPAPLNYGGFNPATGRPESAPVAGEASGD